MISKKNIAVSLFLVLVLSFIYLFPSAAIADETPFIEGNVQEPDIEFLTPTEAIQKQIEAQELKKYKQRIKKEISKSYKKYSEYLTSSQKKKIKAYKENIAKAKTKEKAKSYKKKINMIYLSAAKVMRYHEKWTKRINAYLKGSKMAGCGKYYAKAAYKNNIDPRWAPAISCVESGKGAAYISGTYNAWGWGGGRIHLGNSWEQSIHNYVSQLKKGYGYTLSMSAANKYCGSYWYYLCKSEMSKI